jgi:hypothetical protein
MTDHELNEDVIKVLGITHVSTVVSISKKESVKTEF